MRSLCPRNNELTLPELLVILTKNKKKGVGVVRKKGKETEGRNQEDMPWVTKTTVAKCT